MKNFTELGLAEPLLQAIEELGYEHPMPVQEEVIPYLLNNVTDLVALAQTGTGKTAAYGLPLLQKTYGANEANGAYGANGANGAYEANGANGANGANRANGFGLLGKP